MQTQPNNTLLSLSLSLYPSPSPKPKRQSDLTDRLSWDIGTNQVQRLKQFRWRAAAIIFLNWFSPESSGRWGDDMVRYVWFLILLLILICVALNFQIPHPPFLSLSVYQVPKSTKASTLNIPICISSWGILQFYFLCIFKNSGVNSSVFFRLAIEFEFMVCNFLHF